MIASAAPDCQLETMAKSGFCCESCSAQVTAFSGLNSWSQ
jgi:hypothetical protein